MLNKYKLYSLFLVDPVDQKIELQAFLPPPNSNSTGYWTNLYTFVVPKGRRFIVFTVTKPLKRFIATSNKEMQVNSN